MKKILFISFITFLFAFSFNAYSAEDGFYIGGNVGLSILSDSSVNDEGFSFDTKYDAGYILTVTGGYDFGGYRIEGEISYHMNDLDKFNATSSSIDAGEGDRTSIAILVNGYYDFLEGNNYSPYITAGIGLANVEINDLSVTIPDVGTLTSSADDKVFAYQIGVGVSYELNEYVNLDFGYRYMGTSDPNYGGFDVEYGGHNVLFSIRWYFL